MISFLIIDALEVPYLGDTRMPSSSGIPGLLVPEESGIQRGIHEGEYIVL